MIDRSCGGTAFPGTALAYSFTANKLPFSMRFCKGEMRIEGLTCWRQSGRPVHNVDPSIVHNGPDHCCVPLMGAKHTPVPH